MLEPPCKPGDRIRLIEMPDDPCPIPAGTTGTVLAIQDFGIWHQISVRWDIKRSLALVWPTDKIEVLP